jgi:hypothetical protein
LKSLSEIANLFKVDKFGFDDFATIYEPHLKRLRPEAINILEIGIGGYNNPEEGGQSLRMWKEYFSKAQIVGIDIHDKSKLEEDRIRIFKGDQTNNNFLEHVCNEIGNLSIIIDDGSHISSDVISTFTYLFTKLNKDGIYIIEDLGTSYWPQFGGGFHKDTSMNFLKRLTDCLNHKEFLIQNYEPNYFDVYIKSMHFYRNAVIIYKGDNSKASYTVENGRLKDFKK